VRSLSRSFDDVADVYDDVRPDYPDSVYDAIDDVAGGLATARVVDIAAGSGIATRQLVARGAAVVAVDPGLLLLRRLRARSPTVRVVRAVAEQLPLRSAEFDVACCATAFHWLDAPRAVAEIRRVLRPRAVLAVWWANHLRDDAVGWEAAQGEVYDRWQVRAGSRPPSGSGVAPRETAQFLRSCGLEVVVDTLLTWSRVVPRDRHVRVLSTHSDVIALGSAAGLFLAEVESALRSWQTVTERFWGPLVVARMP
jgi:SAM-dependent methyltransferase